MDQNNSSKTERIIVWIVCILCLCLSVRTTSIWMDEGISYEVVDRSFRSMIHTVLFRGNAVTGMPLYSVLLFFWCKLTGFSEYAMRSMNFVFAALYLWGAIKLIRHFRLPFWTLLVFVVNPLFLYYMNEARPYVGVITFGLWCIYCLCMYYAELKKRYLFLFFAWFLLGCAMHMMFVFMGVAYACMMFCLILEHRLNIKHHLLAWLCCFPFFIPLAILYARLVLCAPEVNVISSNPLESIAQIIFFFAGLGGIGWSRNALRCMNLELSFRIVSGLFLFFLSSLVVLFYFLKKRLFLDAKVIMLTFCFGITMVFFVAANIVLKTRFWERHISYLAPAVTLLLVYVCIDMLKKDNHILIRVSAVSMLALNLYSGISIMLLDYYQKDDYRGAAAAARMLNPDYILLEGHQETFRYYGLNARRAEAISESEENIPKCINISTASQELLESILDKTHGHVALILCEKNEFDPLSLYNLFKRDGIPLRSFSVVLLNNTVGSASAVDGAPTP